MFPMPLNNGAMKSQTFTTSGVWTKPASVSSVYVLLVGAGGSGASTAAANCGQGGGGGQVLERFIPVTGNLIVTVGAGGAAPAGGVDTVGNAGGSTSLSGGASLTATGGHGGPSVNTGTVNFDVYLNGGSSLGRPAKTAFISIPNNATAAPNSTVALSARLTALAFCPIGAAGINGLGGGGGSGYTVGGTSFQPAAGSDGGGDCGKPAGAGVANTGGGGGGGNNNAAGGAGANGVVTITWWE